MKQCSKCKQFKPLSEFYPYKKNKDGLYGYCKKCYNKQQTEWIKNNPKYEKRKRKYQKEYRVKYQKQSYQCYGIGVATIRRYGLKLALEIYDKFKRKCAYCGKENNLLIHHLDNKGRNYKNKGLKPNNKIENLILICWRCHGSIHGKQGGRPKGRIK